jgi:hypothetical protein
VNAVTHADFLLPAGKLSPIRFNDSLNAFPPSFDLALNGLEQSWQFTIDGIASHLLSQNSSNQ